MEIEPGEKMRTKQFNTRMPNAAMHGTGEQVGGWSLSSRELGETPHFWVLYKPRVVGACGGVSVA